MPSLTVVHKEQPAIRHLLHLPALWHGAQVVILLPGGRVIPRGCACVVVHVVHTAILRPALLPALGQTGVLGIMNNA